MKSNNYYQGYALGYFLSEGYQLSFDQALQALRHGDSKKVTPCEDFEEWDYGYLADAIEYMVRGLEHDFIPREEC